MGHSVVENNVADRGELSFVTHLPLQRSGGGVFAVSWQVHRQLQRFFPVSVCGPMQAPHDRLNKYVSKFQRRVLRRPGSFYPFSPGSLQQWARSVTTQLSPAARAAFFRSSTRWVLWQPDRPYFVHTDACFHTFYHNTFAPGEFTASDLQRIWQAEAHFLDRATAVFFESDWGKAKAQQAYGLSGHNFHTARIAGAIEPPESDLRVPDGRFRLLTMAKHFEQKGGLLVAAAFQLLKTRWPQLCWHVLGGPPPAAVMQLQDVHYEGFLKPDLPLELQRMRTLLASGDLLVHPTREDTNPLVIAEAASFGCPCVSMRCFALPELVTDGETGILLDPPATVESLAAAIETLLQNPSLTAAMRTQARLRSLQLFSWDASGEIIANVIRQKLS